MERVHVTTESHSEVTEDRQWSASAPGRMASKTPVIGIDLGTSSSCVGVFQNDKVTIIENDWANRSTPSYVAFTSTECLVGETARMQVTANPENTLFGVKRLIGRTMNDPIFRDKAHWPFEVVGGGPGNMIPKLKVQYRGEETTFFPEEICLTMVAHLKQTAELGLGKTVSEAVVAVPAHFGMRERSIIRDICRLAGLNVLRFVVEPFATALAIGFGKRWQTTPGINSVVFDLGGGHLNVSVLTIENGIFEAKSVTCNSSLGGKDFVAPLVTYVLKEIECQYGRSDISGNRKAMCRIHKACELAKKMLSHALEADIELDNLIDGIDYHTTISRAKFEELNASLFEATLEPVKKALKDAKLDRHEIHNIILAGGCSRIPMIQKLLQDFFVDKPMLMSKQPEESVAYGAAILAAMLSGYKSEFLEMMLLLDIMPHSLGIEMPGGVVATVLKRNSTFPKRETFVFTTQSTNQPAILIRVYEGDSTAAKDNAFLGKLVLAPLPPALKGAAVVEVTFDVDRNYVLLVSAVDTNLGVKDEITITSPESLQIQEGFENLLPVFHSL